MLLVLNVDARYNADLVLDLFEIIVIVESVWQLGAECTDNGLQIHHNLGWQR